MVDYRAALESSNNKWTARLNGGESRQDVWQRVQKFITDLKSVPYDCCLLVSSQVIVKAFYGIANGLSIEKAWELPADEGSCIELELR